MQQANRFYMPILYILLLLTGITSSVAQTDTEFWFAVPNVEEHHTDRPIGFHFTNPSTTKFSTVTISLPAETAFTPKTIVMPPSSSTYVDLTDRGGFGLNTNNKTWKNCDQGLFTFTTCEGPITTIDSLENKPANTINKKGVLITATSPITAYYEVTGLNYQGGAKNGDLFALKGTNALGLEFYTPFQNIADNQTWGTSTNTEWRSAFDIVATENGTVVEITPTQDIVGHLAGITFTVNLNRGETYSGVASSHLAAGHPAGSHIKSNKPIAITIKDDSVNGYGIGISLVGDQIIPTSVFGTEYIVIKGTLHTNLNPLDAKYVEEYAFIGAATDNTQIIIDGTLVATINKGQQYFYPFKTPTVQISASSPVSVFHLTGVGDEVGGAVLPPITCTGSDTVGFTRSSGALTYSISILVPTGGEGDFILNGGTGFLTSADFTNVPNTGGAWKYTQKDFSSAVVDNDNLLTNSTSLFHLGTINGANGGDASYGYFSNFDRQPAVITAQPVNPSAVCASGGSASFSVTATGKGVLNYQWRENGINLANGGIYSGTNTNTLTLTNPGISLDGKTYDVVVSRSCSPTGVTSTSATLKVNPVPDFTVIKQDATTCGGTGKYIYKFTNAYKATLPTGTFDLDFNADGSYESTNQVAIGDSLTVSALAVGTSVSNWKLKPNATTCISNTVSNTLTVGQPTNPLPPTVADISFCQSSVVTGLNATPVAGTVLKWYGLNAAGGTGSTVATIPQTSTVNTTSYYVIDSNSTTRCISSRAKIDVTIHALPTFTIATTNPSTCGGNDGSLRITMPAATTNYAVNYTKGGTTTAPTTFTSNGSKIVTVSTTLTQGIITNIMVRDPNGCSTQDNGPYSLTDPTPPTNTTSTASMCADGVTTRALTGVPSGTWSLAVGSTAGVGTISGTTFTVGSVAGTAIIRNSNLNCNTDINITVNTIPTLAIVNPVAVCAPSTVDLTLGLVTTGSTAGLNYTYFTNNIATTTLSSPNAVSTSNTYFIKGTIPASGCNVVKPVTVIVNAKPTISVAKTDPATCTGTGSAAITITSGASGLYDVDLNGDGTYEYTNQSAASNVITISNLAVGTVLKDVMVRSVTTGCSSVANSINTTITAPAAPNNTTVNTAMCADGVSTRTLSGSAGSWTLVAGSVGSISGTNFTVGNSSGTATIRLTNAGCNSDVSITVNAMPLLTITNPLAVCAPSTVDITTPATTTGSTAGMTLSYFTNAAATIALPSPSAITTSGTYYIKGTIAAGCSDVKPVIVTVKPKPVLSASNTIICSGNTATIPLSSTIAGTTFSYTTAAVAGVKGNYDDTDNPIEQSPINLNNSASVVTYTISGIANGCNANDITASVTINPEPYISTPNIYNYTTVGFYNEQNYSSGCLHLTPENVGSNKTAIWRKEKINLDLPFDTLFSVYLGANDNGADGIAFVLHDDPSGLNAIGTEGGRLGYALEPSYTSPFVSKSLAVEFDNFYNSGIYGDIPCDHISVIKNGDMDNPLFNLGNTNGLSPSVQASPSACNVEDGNIHTARIKWTPNPATGIARYEIYFDDLTTPRYNLSNVDYNTIFGGVRQVYGGWTGATGGNTSEQYVCGIQKRQLCSGTLFNEPLASGISGSTFSWTTPAVAGLSGNLNGSGTSINNTLVNATLSTQYAQYIVSPTANGCPGPQKIIAAEIKAPATVTNPNYTICSNENTNITLTGDQTGITYSWASIAVTGITGNSAGTGGSIAQVLINSTSAAVNVVYQVTPTYNGCAGAVKEITVTVNPAPTLIINNPAGACSPSTVNLTAAAVTSGSAASLTYTYFTDAAGISALASPSSIAASGTYYIKGINAGNCADIKSVVVTVSPKPVFSISKTDAAACGSSGLGSLTITAAMGNYDIDLNGDGIYEYTNQTPAANIVTLSGLAVGTVIKDVTIRSVSTGCISDVNTVNTSITAPSAPSNTTSSTAICADGTSTRALTAAPAGGVWSLAPGSTASIGTISGSTFTVGSVSGTAIIRYTLSGCDADVALIIQSRPTVIITNPPAACSPSTVDLTAANVTVGSTSSLTYTYFSDAAATSALASPSAITTSNTFYIKGSTVASCSDIQPVVTTINPKPLLSISKTDAAACGGVGSASITITAAAGNYDIDLNGDGVYEYINQAPVGNIILLPGLAIGTVIKDVTVKSVTTGCISDVDPVNTSITAPSAASNNSSTTPLCADGVSQRALTATPAGGTWSLAAGSTKGIGSIGGSSFLVGNISGTAIIRYSLLGCDSDISINIQSTPSVVITNPSEVCAPNTIDLTNSAVTNRSTANLGFTYFTDAATNNVLNSPSQVSKTGTYYIKGTTAANCSATAPVNVTVNVKPSVTITNPTAVCSPDMVDITATNITAGSTFGLAYSYFTDTATTAALSNPDKIGASGTYFIKGIDNATTCFDIRPVKVTINGKPTLAITNPSAVCSPSTIDLTVAAVTVGSSAGLSYTYFSDMAATTVLPNPNFIATSNTYYIKGTATNSCSDLQPVVVTINEKPVLTITNPAAVCPPNVINLTSSAITTGSTAGLAFNYFANSTATQILPSPTTIGTSGNYYVVGNTILGCTDTAAINVTVHTLPLIAVTKSDANTCAGKGTVVIDITSPSGNYSIDIDGDKVFDYFNLPTINNSIVLPGLAIGQIVKSVMVESVVTGCSSNADAIDTKIVAPATPVNTTSSQAICAGGNTRQLTAIPSGGTWTLAAGSAATDGAINNTAQTYTSGTQSNNVIIRYTLNNCDADVTIVVNPKPIVPAIAPTTICSNGTTNIPLSADIVSNITWTTVKAIGASGNVAGSGNNIAQKITNTTNASVNVSYLVVATANTCTSDTVVASLTIHPLPSIKAVKHDSICSEMVSNINLVSLVSGATFNYTTFAVSGITGNTSGSGNNIAQKITNNTTSTLDISYSVIATANNCSGLPVQIPLTINPTPVFTGLFSDTICSGQKSVVPLSATVSSTIYSWTTTPVAGIAGNDNGFGFDLVQTLTNVNATYATASYKVAPVANNCTGKSATVTISVYPKSTAGIVTGADTVCEGSVSKIIQVTGHNAPVIKWETATTPFVTWNDIVTSNNSYQTGQLFENTKVRVTIKNSVCDAVTSIPIDIIVDKQINNANAGSDQLFICAPKTTLSANPPPRNNTGLWNIKSGMGGAIQNTTAAKTDFSGIDGNTYTLTWTVTNGKCPSTSDDVLVRINQTPSPAVAGIDQLNICGTTASLAATPPAIGIGRWKIWTGKNGSIADTLAPATSLSGMPANSYLVKWKVTASPVCPSSIDEAIISFSPTPVGDAGPNQTIKLDRTATLNATGGSTYQWFASATLDKLSTANPVASPRTTTTYGVNIFNQYGCPIVDSVTITVLLPINPTNTFTPNGDEENPIWVIKNIQDYPKAEITIFNRWGQVIRKLPYDIAWDGTLNNGAPAEVGTYFYIIDLKDQDYKPQSGSVSILR